MKPDVIVLGAGMVGVSAALHLQKRGRSVVLVDRRGAAEETSYGNGGIIQREGIVPYGFPREWSKILTYALNRSPEANVHWRALPSIGPQLWRYWRHGTPALIDRSARAMRPLIERVVVEHEALMSEAGVTGMLRRTGYLKLYRSQAKLDAALATDLLVLARIDGGPGISLLRVDAKAPGVAIRIFDGFITGLRELTFDNVAVAKEDLVGAEGAAWEALERAMLPAIPSALTVWALSSFKTTETARVEAIAPRTAVASRGEMETRARPSATSTASLSVSTAWFVRSLRSSVTAAFRCPPSRRALARANRRSRSSRPRVASSASGVARRPPMSEPPRLTMPVTRLVVRCRYSNSTPAWMVM